MSVFSPLFSVRESNCFSFFRFSFFSPPFLPSSPGLKFRRHAIGGRTNERTTSKEEEEKQWLRRMQQEQ